MNLEGSPANLYSKEYINEFESFSVQQADNHNLVETTNKLAVEYGKYFNEVSCIAFVGFEVGSYDELIAYLKGMPISIEAKENFIEPFIRCMENEKEIYCTYWNEKINMQKDDMQAFIEYVNQQTASLEKVFNFTKKRPHYYFCVSLDKGKGRGIAEEKMLTAAGCIPKNKTEQQDAFFQAFHEMTHQITDKRFFSHISMADGSHLESEKVVIKADYYFFQRFEKDLLEEYILWVAQQAGVKDASEQNFLMYYTLSDEIENKMQGLLMALCQDE